MAREQQQVLFSGNVQGVGFRFTACRIAAEYDVTGYVRNLPSGQVECVVEGPGEAVSAFIAELAQAMGHYIRDRTAQTASYAGQFGSFTVRY